MLNAALVEHVQAVHRQRQTGVLVAAGPDLRCRFRFEQGMPTAFDLGTDKDELLATKLREYHRVDSATRDALIAAYRSARTPVGEHAVTLGVASADEVASTTRALVEDALVQLFSSSIHQLQFQKNIDESSFDFTTTALRLRIDAEVLLRTVRDRIDELTAVAKAVDPNDVFALAEGGDGDLADWDKQVLNHIDGSANVIEIARLCRTSAAHIARTIHTLLGKGVVRRSTGSSGRRGAIINSHPAARLNTPVDIYRAPRAQQTSPLLWLGVVGVLLAGGGLVTLVVDYQLRQEHLRATTEQVAGLIAEAKWSDALALTDELRRAAGNDLAAMRRVGDLRARVDGALAAERTGIARLLTAHDYARASDRLAQLPGDADSEALTHRLAAEQEAFSRACAELSTQVIEALARDDVAAALAIVDANPSSGPGIVVVTELDRWRLGQLERLASPASPLGQRRKLLEVLTASRPTPRDQGRLDSARADIARQAIRLQEAITQLQPLAAAGDRAGVLELVERQKLHDTVAGTELAAALERVQVEAERLHLTALNARNALVNAVGDGVGVDGISAALASAKTIAKAAPSAATQTGLSAVMTAIDRLGAADALNAAQLAELAKAPDADPALVAAFTARAVRLAELDAAAAAELERVHRLVREGEAEQAITSLDALLTRADWRAAPARVQAVGEREELVALVAKRVGLRAQLTAALAAGDVATSHATARAMGLKYLPLSIESVPAGAEITREDATGANEKKLIGVTPFALDLPAADRAEATFTLRRAGYASVTVSGAQADGGWRLLVALERAPAQTVMLPRPVTAQPTATTAQPTAATAQPSSATAPPTTATAQPTSVERLWLASRQGAVALTADGALTPIAFDQGEAVTLNEPIYAGFSTAALPAMGSIPAAADAVWLATRENIALRLAPGQAPTRWPLAARTDLPLVLFHSPLLVDRLLLIVAGSDGALHGADHRNAALRWHAPAGAAFVGAPVIVGERVLAARRDGSLTAVRAFDGTPAGAASLDAPIIDAWPTAAGLAGCTADTAFRWNGDELMLVALPVAITAAAPDVLVAVGGRVFLKNGDAWSDVGRVEQPLTGPALRWGSRVVVQLSDRIVVLGEGGFAVPGQDLLAPAILGQRLVVTEQAGRVRLYDAP